jgi:hypothetical protein
VRVGDSDHFSEECDKSNTAFLDKSEATDFQCPNFEIRGLVVQGRKSNIYEIDYPLLKEFDKYQDKESEHKLWISRGREEDKIIKDKWKDKMVLYKFTDKSSSHLINLESGVQQTELLFQHTGILRCHPMTR